MIDPKTDLEYLEDLSDFSEEFDYYKDELDEDLKKLIDYHEELYDE